jgi:large conductance mechanosensitive channel
MSFVSEFKSFAMKGNVVDMAVGIIIGVAFGKVVASLVRDVIMQPIGVLVGGVDFSELAYIIQEAQDEAATVAINYGLFIQSINR